MQAYQKKGFWIGIALFLGIYFLPAPITISHEGWITLAITALIASWWSTEAIPLPVTALLPLILLPLLGVSNFQQAAIPYANQNIFLFLGGFMMAIGIEVSGLHKRFALMILSHSGISSAYLVGSFMMVSALISMWIINTATTLMLLPIVIALADTVTKSVSFQSKQHKQNFQITLLLGVAYAATIGGMATLVGTAPNIVFAGFMREIYHIDVSFLEWMKLGLPISMALLFLCWLLLTRFIYPAPFKYNATVKNKLNKMYVDLGPMSKDERKVSAIFLVTIFAWIFRGYINEFELLKNLSDAGIALISALAFFLIPSQNKSSELLTWEQANKLPWGLLILFGGGLSLAAAIVDSGLALWIGRNLGFLDSFATLLVIIFIALVIVLLTEITSNTATTITFLPIVSALGILIGLSPEILSYVVVFAASCAFMLPVATPPNAVIFGSGRITIKQMIRAGILMNILGVLVISLAVYLFIN